MCHALLLPVLCLSGNASHLGLATNQSNATAGVSPVQVAEPAGLQLLEEEPPRL